MGFVRTFTSHYSQVWQILERFNGDLTRREVQGNAYAMDKINRLGFPKYQAQASACSCVIDPERPLHSVPSKKFNTEQIFVLVRMQLRKYVDTQPMERLSVKMSARYMHKIWNIAI